MKKILLSLMLSLTAMAATSPHNTANYMENGGNSWVIDNGGTLSFSGGTIGIEGSAKATFLTTDKLPRVTKVELAAADTGGGVVSWANPESTEIVINRVVFNVKTPASGTGDGAQIDCGAASTSTGSSATLVNNLSLGSAKIVDNLGDTRLFGSTMVKMGPSDYFTCSTVQGATSGLTGQAYIHWQRQ